MKKIIVLLITTLILAIDATPVQLTPREIEKVGLQIFKNEARAKRELLVHWSVYEDFPSLGIGHNIWFPQGKRKYVDQFPVLCAYLQKHGVTLSLWLQQALIAGGAPWSSRQEFLQDRERTEELRDLLASTINVQTVFMIERLDKQLPIIIAAAPEHDRGKVKRCIELMRSSLLGNYALIDYLNFKGAGLGPRNTYVKSGGLLQVLSNVPDNVDKDTVLQAFTLSAGKILLQRIHSSITGIDRLKYSIAWLKRVSTYSDPTLFNPYEAFFSTMKTLYTFPFFFVYKVDGYSSSFLWVCVSLYRELLTSFTNYPS